jgi:hypothetical protein
MPSSEAILNMAFALANEWRWVAIVWHVAFVTAAIMALGGARVSQRTAALILTLPIISVSLLAWSAGNPFNGLVFMVLVQLMAGLATTLGPRPIAVDSAFRNRAVGGALVIFGLSYPHFLIADSWLVYLYAAPFGLIPCPTIAVVSGASLILGSFGSRAWAIVVSVVALAYGIIGVVALHVWIDTFLIAGGLLLLETCFPMKARRLVATKALFLKQLVLRHTL